MQKKEGTKFTDKISEQNQRQKVLTDANINTDGNKKILFLRFRKHQWMKVYLLRLNYIKTTMLDLIRSIYKNFEQKPH